MFTPGPDPVGVQLQRLGKLLHGYNAIILPNTVGTRELCIIR